VQGGAESIKGGSAGGAKKKLTASAGDLSAKKANKSGMKRERKVRFVLEKNLEFPQAAPAPRFVRTPPSSMPKGSALKPGSSQVP